MPVEHVARRQCPVCGSAATRHLHSQRFSGISEASLLRGYDIVACITCGFVYADGILEPGAFEAYYRDLSKYEYAATGGNESDSDRARFEETADVLSQAITSRDSRVLEIGCSTGGLLAALKRRGYRRLVGVDPAPYCAEAAQRLHGISVLTASIDTLPASLQADFVILIAVLEHLGDPGGALARIRGLLAPGGRLYAEVPDASRFALFEDAPFQQFSTEHINFFPETSLSNLMGALSLRPVFCGRAVRQHSDTTKDPTVYGVYEVSVPGSQALVRDSETEKGILDYIGRSEATDHSISGFIMRTVEGGRTILVWGVGTHTQRLLATCGLAKANIAAFVGSNPKYHGKLLNGLPILAPTDLQGRQEPILVSTRVHQRGVVHQIRSDLRLANELILLYDL
jgi:SAM-dependent methyltransferase